MSSLSWYFPSTGGGQVSGFNDAAREHFEGIHEHFLAREVIQNSLDARLSKSEPVRVVFEMRRVNPSSIQNLTDLKTYFEKARDFSKNQEGATEFYDHALDVLTQNTMMILRIGDYNTKGLTGGDMDQDGNWARLIIMEGASSKKGDGGGSFGIGKNAAYVASAIRTVYYSTYTADGNKAFQGKSKISSFEVDDDIKQGTGMYGITTGTPASLAAREESDIPSDFIRNEQGTDVFIAGYEPTSDDEPWRFRLIESVLNNFWAALHFGDLIVEFSEDGEETTVINSENLKQHLETHKDSEDSPLPYYFALTEGKLISDDLKHLKQVKLYVKTKDDYPKRIQLMRSPKMVVRKKRVHTLHENYAAVFLCDNETGNDILRAIEPPAHNDWDPKRKNGQYRAAINEMNTFIKESLRKLNPYDDKEPEDIPDLGKYLADIEERDDLMEKTKGSGEKTDKTNDDESPREVGADEPPQMQKPSLPKTQEMTVVNTPGGGSTKRERTGGSSSGGGSGGGGDGDKDVPTIDTSSFTFRSYARKNNNEIEYGVLLHPTKDVTGSIRIMAIGEDSDYPVEIKNVIDENGQDVDFKDSLIKGIELKKNQKRQLVIKLYSNRRYALGVETHEF